MKSKVKKSIFPYPEDSRRFLAFRNVDLKIKPESSFELYDPKIGSYNITNYYVSSCFYKTWSIQEFLHSKNSTKIVLLWNGDFKLYLLANFE